ncbi:hypothetical protein [Lentzea sp.]|uniref:hypothetical protein n=1 Tax=Lentzea sp. TaxID=56099 RepID=UPI003BB87A4C
MTTRTAPPRAARAVVLASATLTITAAAVIAPSLPAMGEVYGEGVLVRLALTVTSLAIVAGFFVTGLPVLLGTRAVPGLATAGINRGQRADHGLVRRTGTWAVPGLPAGFRESRRGGVAAAGRHGLPEAGRVDVPAGPGGHAGVPHGADAAAVPAARPGREPGGRRDLPGRFLSPLVLAPLVQQGIATAFTWTGFVTTTAGAALALTHEEN